MQDIEKITDKKELLDFVFMVELLYMKDSEKQKKLLSSAVSKAKELGALSEFSEKYADLERIKREEDENLKRAAYEGTDSALETDGKGNTVKSVGNYLKILRNDEYFSSLRYNEMNHKGEFEGKSWSDTYKSQALHYIESMYRLKSERDLDHALNIIFRERSYHPVQEKIKSLKWDGQSRIDMFLTAFMDAGNTPYVRECSRLIFHCGIARLFSPGCKVDDIVVLQGEQGNGKTTIVQWLCMSDDWYGRITDIRGNTGIEQIQGKWICEVSELLAISGCERQEEAKQYFDRRADTYRKPYAQYPEDIPRSCIFIGTTNLRQPFKDRTGNRRYYPVWCNVKRGFVYEYEAPIRYYIEQCWAEAYTLWLEGKIEHTVRKEMYDLVAKYQNEALEDDWRRGEIEAYIEDKECVCVLEIWEKALGQPGRPNVHQSREMGLILDSFKEWGRTASTRKTESYGKQRCWIKNLTEDDFPDFK